MVSPGAELRQLAHDHLLLHFTRNGAYGEDSGSLLVLERGEGPYVYDSAGRRYIDALSSLFCCQIGYSYGAEIAAAATRQLEQLSFNTNWGTAHPPAIRLAAKLAELAPGELNRAFFTSGGSDSVEAAWKIARLYHLANGEQHRTKAIARRIAYHGATLGALSFTGVEPMKAPFGTPPVPVTHVSNTNAFRAPDGGDEPAFCRRLLDEIEQTIQKEGPDTIGMLIAEPVQNAGGCLLPPAGYWPGLRELCDRYGILLCADEVITGFGRLGEWLGSTRYDATPDLVTLAKGLTSAYAPMGAVLVTDRVAAPLYEQARTLLHGVTFGGHPLAAAIALKNIEIFERDNVIENVRRQEQYLEQRLHELRSLPIVGDVRGAGFFWAIELTRDEAHTRFDQPERDRLLRGFLPPRLLEAGLIARADDRGDAVLQIAPPLICGRDVLDQIVDKLGAVLEAAGTYMQVGGSAEVQVA